MVDSLKTFETSRDTMRTVPAHFLWEGTQPLLIKVAWVP